MERIEFYKMSAGGNDFILIDDRQGRWAGEEIPCLVKRLCRRRFSVGADGLIFIYPSEKAHFKWRFFNADGGEVEMCGNGARCVAKLAYTLGIAPAQLSFETLAGIVEATVTGQGVRLKMPEPYGLKPSLELSLDNRLIEGGFVNTGVPHVVCLVDDLENYPVVELGRQIRYHGSFFPEGTNANFVQIVGEGLIAIRTYERGVEDETMACGTGATASALLVSIWQGFSSPIEVLTRGGERLSVSFQREGRVFSQVYLEGPARIIYQGFIWPEALTDAL